MRVRLAALFCLTVLGTAAEPLLLVGVPEPRTFDLRGADLRTLLPADTRDPAQAEQARKAMNALVAPYGADPSLRLVLPRTGEGERLLLAASQALKAQNPAQSLFLAFDPGMEGIWDEMIWGALDGGALLPGDLGPDPALWEQRLSRAQEILPGRPWTLWAPRDPGHFASTLMGDGAHLVVPRGGPTAALANEVPDGFTQAEGGGDALTLRRPGTGEVRRWRFEAGAWKSAALPKDRNMVTVTAQETYNVGALLARVRATSLRDRSALRNLEASLTVDLHIQGFSGPGTDFGYRFRYFQMAGEPEELLQKEVLFNGVRANLKGDAQLPVIEAKSCSSLPVALVLTERYRYGDGGPGSLPGTRKLTFQPADGDATLYSGRLLVEETSGRILEERSHREGLPGLVKSESRTLTYGEPSPGLWTLTRLESHDRWFLGNETVLVQRRMVLDGFNANGPDFETSRRNARRSSATMMVQTPEGLRYYKRQDDGSRKVDDRSRTAGRALGAFLLVDPSSEMPVAPLGAMVFYDFDAWGRGVQYSFLTAVLFNAGSLSVPNAFLGFDLESSGSLTVLKNTDRPVQNGKLLDSEGVGRRRQTSRLSIGHDLGLGFRYTLTGNFEFNQYSLAPDRKYRTPGFLLPPSGLDRRVTSTLSWQGKALILQASYGLGRRPDGTYGLPDAPTHVRENGEYHQWQAQAGYNLDLGLGRWLDLGLGHMGGSGFDRFKALEVGGLGSEATAPGLRSGAIAADRVDYGRISYVLPTGPSLRLTFKLGCALMRSLDNQKTYSFTGLGVGGDLPGFWRFTTTRVDLGAGLQSQIPGVRTVNCMISLLRVF